jgi:3'-phosphoadenosine 5'-phosphosulfate sulfotransferase (PAPS reductase)/FAD synthetase
VSEQDELPIFGEIRTARYETRVAESHAILDAAIAQCDGFDLRGIVILFSGGNDSTTLAHLFRDRATHAAHANTGIGIEQTRQFVRDRCAEWGLPLLERRPEHGYGYRDLVLGEVLQLSNGEPLKFEGFPGPSAHRYMYFFLKERQMRKVRNELCPAGARTQRVIYLSGIRRSESKRRAKREEIRREESVLWVNPMLHWTAEDLNTYRKIHEVPRNEVADLIHMSGECLCGAFAKPGELDEIGYWFPEVAQEIRDLEAEAAAKGVGRCAWGWGYKKEAPSKTGPMCSACDLRYEKDQLDLGLEEP